MTQNALRYTHSGGVVLRVVEHGKLVRVLVGDSGIGIPAIDTGRIFEEYFQVDNKARDRRKGLGLGLAIVRDLAALLSIRVRVKSRVGRGSVFVIDIPRSTVQHLTRTKHPVEAVTNDYVRGALVVLIDDDPLARDGVTTTLKDFGCRVVPVASGLEALHALSRAEFTPQLVIADYRLEGGSTGLEAIAMVIQNQAELCGEAFKLPALLISGDTSPLELLRVSGAGLRMIHKPVSVEFLYKEMNALLAASAKSAA